MTGRKRRFGTGAKSRLSLFLVTVAADQYTKYLARVNFGFPDGEPDYFKVKQVIGEWLQFRLVYNQGAAFGMKPQQLLPFLNPTLFFALFSAVAITVLILYYRKLAESEYWQKTGVALILSGAVGNLIDRLRFAKVTDFIDVGIPGMAYRWPTFNIADSCVCVGVALILLAPMFSPAPAETASTPTQRPDAPAPGSMGQSHSGPNP